MGSRSVELPDEPKLKLEAIWELLTLAKTNNGTGPRLLNLEKSSVKIIVKTNKTEKSDLLGHAKRASTLYPVFSPNYLIKYDSTPELEVVQSGEIIIALLEVNAHYSSSDVASPLFATFYWVNSEKKWHPWELAKFRSAMFRTLF